MDEYSEEEYEWIRMEERAMNGQMGHPPMNPSPITVPMNYSGSIFSPAMKLAPHAELWRLLQMWVPQMADHVTFASLGIEEPALKQMALDASPVWESLRSEVSNPLPLDVETVNAAVNKTKEQLTPLRAYKTHLIESANQGWIGWLYPSFLQHIRDELDYFDQSLATLQGSPAPMTKASQLCFLMKMTMEHLGFASGLVDPNLEPLLRVNLIGQQAKVGQAYQTACNPLGGPMQRMSAAISSGLDRIDLNALSGDAVKVFSSPMTANGKSVIHPVLLAHVVREQNEFVHQLGNM